MLVGHATVGSFTILPRMQTGFITLFLIISNTVVAQTVFDIRDSKMLNNEGVEQISQQITAVLKQVHSEKCRLVHGTYFSVPSHSIP